MITVNKDIHHFNLSSKLITENDHYVRQIQNKENDHYIGFRYPLSFKCDDSDDIEKCILKEYINMKYLVTYIKESSIAKKATKINIFFLLRYTCITSFHNGK